MFRRAVLAAFSGLVLLLLAGTARADVPPPALVLSNWETSVPGNKVSRDCGFSEKVPGNSAQSVWLFCDSEWSGSSSGFWLGTTAAIGPSTAGQVPTGLTEIPTPPAPIGTLPSNRPPAGFLAIPSGLKLPNGADCSVPGSSYPASWITGVAREPSTADTSKLLITYTDTCVHPGGFLSEAYGVVEYKPSTNTLSGQTRVFAQLTGLPFQKVLGSPIFSGGYLYVYGYVCTNSVFGECQEGKVVVAQVSANPTAWRVGENYRFWTGSTWSSDHAAATSIIPSIRPVAIHVDDFSALGKGFVMIEQPDISGLFRVWRSTSLTGGWTLSKTGNAPCTDQSGFDLCRAYFGHPGLSTSANLLMSYYNPGDDHVGVMAVPW